MKFNEKIFKLRKMKGLTQDEFASAVGVSRQAVYKWESGQSYPEVPKLLEMKMLFDISLDDLLDDNYEVVVPEKQKKKRAPKIEAAPKAEEPKTEEAEETKEPALVSAEVNEDAAPIEEAAPIAEAAPAEETAPVKEEAPLAEKKKGLFSRIFGRK